MSLQIWKDTKKGLTSDCFFYGEKLMAKIGVNHFHPFVSFEAIKIYRVHMKGFWLKNRSKSKDLFVPYNYPPKTVIIPLDIYRPRFLTRI